MALLALCVCGLIVIMGSRNRVPLQVVAVCDRVGVEMARITRTMALLERVSVVHPTDQPDSSRNQLLVFRERRSNWDRDPVMLLANEEPTWKSDVLRSLRGGQFRRSQLRDETEDSVFNTRWRLSGIANFHRDIVLLRPVVSGVDAGWSMAQNNIGAFNYDRMVSNSSIDEQGEEREHGENTRQRFHDGQSPEKRSASILIGFVAWCVCLWLASRTNRFDVLLGLFGCGALILGLWLA